MRLRDISYINIMNFLLYNYYGNNLIYTAYIYKYNKYDLFILYRTAAIYSHIDHDATRDATFILDMAGGGGG